MSRTPIDRRAASVSCLVIHPERAGAQSLRGPEARLEEAVGLARALDLEVRDARVMPLRKVAPPTLFGKGRVEEIATMRRGLDAEVIVIDDQLTPGQQRNLEKAWDAKVVDRTGLILEIFARRARTGEGKLQVELARMAYERSRLVRTWTHLERQRGGLSKTGGPGETQIELDRRQLADRIALLKKQLEEVRRTRTLHRKARERTPYPAVALVGYTNAGKSTLFNRLTRAEVSAKDMLFATLDPTLRQLDLPDGRPAILSDTVGFISDLPHELVEAFRATLEEVQEADVILHVRDVAGPDSAAQAEDVEQVLESLGAGPESGRALIEVWNKIDLLPDDERAGLIARETHISGRMGAGRAGGTVAVPVSAVTGEGVEALLAAIAAQIDQSPPVQVDLSAQDGEALAWLYRHGRVLDRADGEGGEVKLNVRLDPQALGRFERLYPGALD